MLTGGGALAPLTYFPFSECFAGGSLSMESYLSTISGFRARSPLRAVPYERTSGWS